MMNAKELLRQTESLLLQNDHITLAEASATQLHNALSTAAMNVDFHSSGNDIHSFGVDKFSSNNCKVTIGYFQNFVVANKH